MVLASEFSFHRVHYLLHSLDSSYMPTAHLVSQQVMSPVSVTEGSPVVKVLQPLLRKSRIKTRRPTYRQEGPWILDIRTYEGRNLGDFHR